MARPRKPEGDRASNISPTGVRLPPDLRNMLQREAVINGRSLSHELTVRLRASFEPGEFAARMSHVRALEVRSAHYVGESGPLGTPAAPLGDSQRLLLSYFNGLTPDKQLALLTLLAR